MTRDEALHVLAIDSLHRRESAYRPRNWRETLERLRWLAKVQRAKAALRSQRPT